MMINKNLFKNSFFLSLPGILAIFLSLISIPIHIEVAGLKNYGNYLLFHIFLTLSFLLNMGLAKTLVIAINKVPTKYKSQITYEGLKYCFLICLSCVVIFFLLNHFNFFSDIFPFSKISFLIGLILSIIYLVLEAIYQSNKFFYNLAISNFIFYSLSLTIPSMLLVYYGYMETDELIQISILIKISILIWMALNILTKRLIKRSKNKILINYIKINSFWITIYNLLVQFYEMFDKYIISIILGPSFLSIYSIPQQITGKLTVISRAFSSYLLPYLSSGQKKLDFNQSINIFLSYMPLIIFLLFPLYESFLKLWLDNNYNYQILDLTKVFSLVAIFSSNSHLLITKFEADQESKKNFYYEIIILPLFLMLLVFFVSSLKSLLLTAYLILAKETILLFVRLFNLKNKIFLVKKYSINILSFLILLKLSLFDEFLYFYLFISILLIFNFYNDRKHN